MFTVSIEKLEMKCIIGILDFERKKKQKIRIDAEIEYDYDMGFLDYTQAVLLIKKSFKKEKFYLLEDAQLFLAKKLKKKFPQISRLKIKILKPSILPDCRVGIEFERQFNS